MLANLYSPGYALANQSLYKVIVNHSKVKSGEIRASEEDLAIQVHVKQGGVVKGGGGGSERGRVRVSASQCRAPAGEGPAEAVNKQGVPGFQEGPGCLY